MTQKEEIKSCLKGGSKHYKQIADETGFLAPSVRRVLGEGAKIGDFKRIAKGVYALKVNGNNAAVIYSGDAIEVLPKLAKKKFKFDMIYLDIPYNTPAVVGGNRGIKYPIVEVWQFDRVISALEKLLKDKYSPIIYMYSKAPSGLNKMKKYNNVFDKYGFKLCAEGNYYKYYPNGERVTNMRGDIILPEGILIFNKTGVLRTKPPLAMEYHFERPKGYQTEKPAGLLNSLISKFTKRRDKILDPFMGSGVTIAEAVRLHRVGFGIEILQSTIDNFAIPKIKEALI